MVPKRISYYLMIGFFDFEKIIKRRPKKANNKTWHIFDEKKKN